LPDWAPKENVRLGTNPDQIKGTQTLSVTSRNDLVFVNPGPPDVSGGFFYLASFWSATRIYSPHHSNTDSYVLAFGSMLANYLIKQATYAVRAAIHQSGHPYP
jgi:hypothetical protein